MQRLFPPPPIAAPVHRPIGPPVTLMRMSALSPTLQAVRTAVEAQLARALPSPGSFVADDDVWAELERTDRAFSASTLTTLTPLLDWLTARGKGDPR